MVHKIWPFQIAILQVSPIHLCILSLKLHLIPNLNKLKKNVNLLIKLFFKNKGFIVNLFTSLKKYLSQKSIKIIYHSFLSYFF